jgi:hypothetical protein
MRIRASGVAGMPHGARALPAVADARGVVELDQASVRRRMMTTQQIVDAGDGPRRDLEIIAWKRLL